MRGISLYPSGLIKELYIYFDYLIGCIKTSVCSYLLFYQEATTLVNTVMLWNGINLFTTLCNAMNISAMRVIKRWYNQGEEITRRHSYIVAWLSSFISHLTGMRSMHDFSEQMAVTIQAQQSLD